MEVLLSRWQRLMTEVYGRGQWQRFGEKGLRGKAEPHKRLTRATGVERNDSVGTHTPHFTVTRSASQFVKTFTKSPLLSPQQSLHLTDYVEQHMLIKELDLPARELQCC